VSERIRWEPNGDGDILMGYIGTRPGVAFRIYAPSHRDCRWLLSVRLIEGGKFIYDDGPDDLKAEAERWLEEFVSSLGASFGAGAIVRWQDVRDGDLVLLDDCLITAERAEICQKPWGDGTDFTAADIYHRLDNGVLVSSERHGDRYTAVRRAAGKEAR